MNCLDKIKEISFNGKVFPIKYYFCSDWKFAALVHGLNAANSNHPCLWCTRKKDKKGPIFLDGIGDPRSIDEQNKTLDSGKKINGYTNKSLIPNIGYKNTFIGTLHLFLRASDKLQELFIEKIAKLDSYAAGEKLDFKKKHVNIAKYFFILETSCKLKLTPIVSKDAESGAGKL